jgi:hypothetical protein
MEKNKRRGVVTATYTVWCRACGASFTAPENVSRAVAESHWLGLGWIWSRGKWICPACFSAERQLGI